jgi:hypothetical protein
MALWIAKTHRPTRDFSHADNRRAMPDLFEENKNIKEIQFSAPANVADRVFLYSWANNALCHRAARSNDT